ncbi:MAG: O-antigen ligase family protein [Ruminococcus sp.]|nr:O-antigen ligase family protein [Ruminococcus sp.]
MPKTIFGTTEKSNFILNMKDETIEKLPLIGAKMVAIVFLIGQAIPVLIDVIAKLIGFGMGRGYGFLNTPYICLAITWVVSIIMLVILGSRQRFSKKHHTMLIVLISLICVWSIISAIQSFSFLDAFNGFYGRTTGVLTILSCATIFLLMSFNSSENHLKSIVKILIISSAVQCVIGIVQILSCFVSTELSAYENLNSISLYSVCLPSGFSESPIFFAEYLGLMLGITLTISCFEKSKFYTIMSMVYVYLMLDTHTVVGVVGVISIVLISLIVMIVKKGRNVLPIILCVVVGGITVAVSFILDGSYIFYDGSIMWQDSFYRVGSTGYYWQDTAEFDITNVKDVFSYLWSKAMYYIGLYPLVGTGPDCLIYAQLGNLDSTTYINNGFDLVYNNYLQVAVTMGIPALIFYIATLVYAIVKISHRLNDSIIFKGIFVSIIAFCIMSFFSVNAISIMPYICLFLGLACSKKFTLAETIAE